MNLIPFTILQVLACTIISRSNAWEDDLITELPDYGQTKTPHYSGYLNGTNGCDTATNGPICQIHYWLALSENDAYSNPIVLWLNGGPGSSSLLGFLQEEGPLMMSADGTLMDNPYGWTKHVNLLAIEAPIGVGYSYCSRQLDGKPCVNTDRYTASTSRAALVNFFEKFPEFQSNEFYIAGESYAGVYIPTLAKELLDHTDINLMGVAVGDPCTDNKAQADSMDVLWYGHKYGLVDDEIYDTLWNECRVRMPNLMTKGGIHKVIHTLNHQLKQIPIKQRKSKANELYHALIHNNNNNNNLENPQSPKCKLAYRKFLISSSNALSQEWKDMYIDDYSLFAPVSSLEDTQMSNYMSRKDVRKALHVEDAPTSTWPDADVGFNYTSEYDVCNDNVVVNKSMIDFYKEIVPKLQRTWIYNGDTDPCVSYEGTRLAVKQIQINELDGGSYRPWFYNQTAVSLELVATKAVLFGPGLVTHDMGAQFGGEVTDYDQGLKFVTFHGSGHMVPQFQPQAALHFIRKFVNGEELSPLLPLNRTIEEISFDGFEEAFDGWTEAAMRPPFVDADVGGDGEVISVE